MIRYHDYIWDSCVLLNVLASNRIVEVIRTIEEHTYVCAEVQRESFYLLADDGTDDLIEINLEPHFETGALRACEVNGPAEAALLVDFSTSVDDGEANTLAIAISRGWGVATDDRKARRVFLENNPNTEMLVSTSEIMRHWAELANPSDEELRETLLRIERQASFIPPKSDPNLEWWTNLTL